MDKVLDREEGNTDRKQEASRQEASLFFCLKQRFSVLEGGKVEDGGQMKKRGIVQEGIKNVRKEEGRRKESLILIGSSCSSNGCLKKCLAIPT